MAYSEILVSRLQKILSGRQGIDEKKMFGGLSFLVNGKMFCGVLKNDLVVRVNPHDSETLLKRAHVRPMDFTGRPMKGFLYVGLDGCKTDEDLQGWVDLSLNFMESLPVKKIKKIQKKSI